VYESAQKIVEVRTDLKKYEKLEEKLKAKLSKEEEDKLKKQLDEIGIRNYSFK
jgi:flagellar biosynthesis chaperone FliJ